MAKTKCPARYKNLGLETFGNKKKVTEEILKQFCKNDEYLYQQIRILLDLTDPESRKRFHPPNFENEIKSFGYVASEKDGKKCYKFDNGGDYNFGINFNTKDDDVIDINGTIYYNDESIIDFNRSEDVDILVTDNEENGYVRIHEDVEPTEVEDKSQPIYSPEKKSTTIQTTKKVGSPKKDSYCYGPYGAMKPNGWWYVGFDKNKNYNIKSKWKKKPYTEGIPTKCRAQTFTARHTGYITKVNLNVITESNKKTASPFSCEIWKTKKGVPYGGPIARVEESFTDSNAYSGAHIRTFKFKKKAMVTKGHKYAIVMRSPLSHEGACYRIAGWPRTCYTNYMKGSYYYGYAFQSLDNGKTWLRYDKNAYGKLNASKSTMPIAFGFEVYVQPTKTKIKTKPKSGKKLIGYEPTTVETPIYNVGDHYLYFNIPATNPITKLTIDERGCGDVPEECEILWDISYDGDNFNNNHMIGDVNNGAGDYDLSQDKPTFIVVRCNLKNTNKYKTPTLRSVHFLVETTATRKAYIRSLPYCPESETMLPACIWSEVNADYEQEDGADVKIDIIKEVEAQQTISIRKDTIEDLWDYYRAFYPTAQKSEFSDDDAFREEIQKDYEFRAFLKTLEPPVYIISSYPSNHEKYFEYFDKIELLHYPAYPLLSCNKILGEAIIDVEDFEESNYNPPNTEYILKLNREVNSDLINIVFQEPQNEDDKQEGVIETVLEYDENYTYVTDWTSRQTGFSSDKDYAFTQDKKGIIFNLNGANMQKHIVLGDDGNIKCFKALDGTLDGNVVEGAEDVTEDGYTGNIIQLVINLRDTAYIEHMNYTVDYNTKSLIPKSSMRNNLSSCELLITYNPLWIRDLTSKDFPLKMDMWTETFVVSEEYMNADGKIEYTTKVAPRDNLREVVLWDDEDTLTRDELVEDIDFTVDYQKNKIVFEYPIAYDTPVTIRYTPNLTETSLSIGYRMDRENDTSQAYVYSNYFTTRT